LTSYPQCFILYIDHQGIKEILSTKVEKPRLTDTNYWNKLLKGAFTKLLILYTLHQSPSYAYQISIFVKELTC